MRRRTVALGLATLALVAGCGSSGGEASSSAPPARSPSASASDSRAVDPVQAKGVEHIHNLSLLEDGTLLVGTHEGLWRQGAPGEDLESVGEPFDVMGFALDGDTWIASGHPEEGAAGPADLGLLRSADQGRSWDVVALSGQVDFHRLVQSKNTILGANSGDGLLWRSTDNGESWKTLGTAPFDIALDPADPRRVVGTTAEGLVVSEDGGKRWDRKPAPGRPIALLAWSGETLYGVDVSGAVQRSLDAGGSWEALGDVKGAPEALAATGDTVAVLADGTVWVSRDAGQVFEATIDGPPQH